MNKRYIILSYRIAAVAVGITLITGIVRYAAEYGEVPEWFRYLLMISVVLTSLTGLACIALLLVLAKYVQINKADCSCRKISFWMLWLIPWGIPLGLLSFSLLKQGNEKGGQE